MPCARRNASAALALLPLPHNNIDRLPFEADLVPQLPCIPTVTAYSEGGLPFALGVWPYQPVPGTITLRAAGMPAQSQAWASLRQLYACEIGRYIQATHTCSYECFLSQFAAGGQDANSCLLWRTDEVTGGDGDGDAGGARRRRGGSFCYSFPSGGRRQYPFHHIN